jgi:hypothetical protein
LFVVSGAGVISHFSFVIFHLPLQAAECDQSIQGFTKWKMENEKCQMPNGK